MVSGLEPQEALRAIPAAAARIIASFIIVCILLLVIWVIGESYYLAGATYAGAGSGVFSQQEALTITPQAAAAIAINLIIFIIF